MGNQILSGGGIEQAAASDANMVTDTLLSPKCL